MTEEQLPTALARSAIQHLHSSSLPSILSAGKNVFGIDLFSIQCSLCHRYFHGRCVHLPLSTALTLSSYECPVCSPSRRYPKLPTLIDPDLLFPPLSPSSPSSLSADDPFAVDKHGNTFLHMSVLLMDDPPSPPHPFYSAIPSLLTITNRDGYTPLHLACLLHLPAFLSFFLSFFPLLPLLSSRTTPFRTTVHSSTFLYELGGNTPLHLACQEGDEECVDLILSAIGLSPPASLSPPSSTSPSSSSSLIALTSSRNDAGLTPLDLLCLSSLIPVTRRQELLHRYSAVLTLSGDEAGLMEKLQRQKRRVDRMDAFCRAVGVQGRVRRQFALLCYAMEEEEKKGRADEGREEEGKEEEVMGICAYGGDCRFRDAQFGVMRFIQASRVRMQDSGNESQD